MVDFGEKLKRLRTEAGFTQADLAKRLNVTKAVVSYYELQERMPSPEVLKKLANIFHVTADYLLGLDHRKMLDVTDLSEDDMHLLLFTIETLRRKNQKL
jgi:transcriptional regulator with XRE-family HTH domain